MEIFQGFQNCLCFYSSIKTEAVLFLYIYIYIYLYIYIKLSPKWKKFHEQKVFFFRFYILCENFSKIGPIIKKIQKFQSDPLNTSTKEFILVNNAIPSHGIAIEHCLCYKRVANVYQELDNIFKNKTYIDWSIVPFHASSKFRSNRDGDVGL